MSGENSVRNEAYQWFVRTGNLFRNCDNSYTREISAITILGAYSFYDATRFVDFSAEQLKYIESLKREALRTRIDEGVIRQSSRAHNKIEGLVKSGKFRKPSRERVLMGQYSSPETLPLPSQTRLYGSRH